MKHKFSIKKALRVGWEATRKDFWFFVCLLILVLIVEIGLGFLYEPFEDMPYVGGIPAMVIEAAITLGLIYIAIKLVDKKRTEYFDLFRASNVLHKYIISSIIYHIIVGIGFVLLIVPGIIWAIQFKFYGYFIVDKKMGPIEALKASSRLTKGAKWDLFWFNLILIGILILGVLALLVGLFVAIPLIMVSTAYVYRELLKKS